MSTSAAEAPTTAGISGAAAGAGGASASMSSAWGRSTHCEPLQSASSFILSCRGHLGSSLITCSTLPRHRVGLGACNAQHHMQNAMQLQHSPPNPCEGRNRTSAGCRTYRDPLLDYSPLLMGLKQLLHHLQRLKKHIVSHACSGAEGSKLSPVLASGSMNPLFPMSQVA